jgi:hypothetical protein
MNTWQSELVKELKTVSQGKQEAGQPTAQLDELIGQLETVACDESHITSRLNELGLQWFASKVNGLGYHTTARAENDKDVATD